VSPRKKKAKWGEKQQDRGVSLYCSPPSQELVSDCSFVASLCICAAFERRFGRQLITRIIYPQDKRGNPVYNPGGKYMVKLWANGVARKVCAGGGSSPPRARFVPLLLLVLPVSPIIMQSLVESSLTL
jgi:hypothetical protein